MKRSSQKKDMPTGKRKGTMWIRAFLVSGLVVVLGGGLLLGLFQGNNIKALFLAFTSDPQQLQLKQEEQGKKRDEILEKYGLTPPATSGGTQSSASQAGSSAGQLEDRVPEGETSHGQEQSQEEQASTSAGSSSSYQQAAQSQEDEMQAKIQAYVAQLYDLEEDYRGQLEQLAEETKLEFWGLPKDQQTKENKLAMVKTKTEELIEKEKECDAQVETILQGIQAVLDEEGVDSGLVSEIRAHYEDCKATWKAACLTELYK